MKNMPQPFWAVLLAFLGVIVGLCCLYHAGKNDSVTLGVLGIASNLVSGALGAFAGHATANNKTDVTTVSEKGIISADA